MKKAIYVLLFVVLLPPVMARSQDKKITVANLVWLPYCGQFLPNYGIAPEVITEAFNRVGYKVEYHFMAWTFALEQVKKGKYDAIGTAYFTEERAQDYHFTDPYMDSPIVFFKRKEEDVGWSGDIQDLKSYRIGVVKGYANSPEFDAADYLRKIESRTEVLLLKKLLYKQTDMVVIDQFAGYHTIGQKLIGYDKHRLEHISPPLVVNPLYLMFSKNIPGFTKKAMDFNIGLNEIKKDGTLKKILAKHGFVE